MKRIAILVLSAFTMTALSGCADATADEGPTQVVPEGISDQDIEDLEALALAEFPNAYAFPGQELLDPVMLVFDTDAAPQGSGGLEYPHDWGVVKMDNEIIAYDLSEHVPAGQPVEIRIKLKWTGGPGVSGDFDIYVNVPGVHDAYEGNRYSESMNWNTLVKSRIVDAVRVDGQPFEVGVEFGDGKAFTDDVPFELFVELHFVKNVLAPGIPYALNVPEGTSGIIVESEPVTGDEHITSDVVFIGPDDQLIRHMHHNDISTETLFIPVKEAGEYIVYASHMEGGFLRLETDVPNEDFQVRPLTAMVDETIVHSGAAPGTFDEMCIPRTTFTVSSVTDQETCSVEGNDLAQDSEGTSGTLDAGSTFPLEVYTYLEGGVGNGPTLIRAINSAGDPIAGAYTTGGHYDGNDRLGFRVETYVTPANIIDGQLSWFAVQNGGDADLGVGIVTYQR